MPTTIIMELLLLLDNRKKVKFESQQKIISKVLLHEKFNTAAEPGCYFVVDA